MNIQKLVKKRNIKKQQMWTLLSIQEC